MGNETLPADPAAASGPSDHSTETPRQTLPRTIGTSIAARTHSGVDVEAQLVNLEPPSGGSPYMVGVWVDADGGMWRDNNFASWHSPRFPETKAGDIEAGYRYVLSRAVEAAKGSVEPAHEFLVATGLKGVAINAAAVHVTVPILRMSGKTRDGHFAITVSFHDRRRVVQGNGDTSAPEAVKTLAWIRDNPASVQGWFDTQMVARKEQTHASSLLRSYAEETGIWL